MTSIYNNMLKSVPIVVNSENHGVPPAIFPSLVGHIQWWILVNCKGLDISAQLCKTLKDHSQSRVPSSDQLRLLPCLYCSWTTPLAHFYFLPLPRTDVDAKRTENIMPANFCPRVCHQKHPTSNMCNNLFNTKQISNMGKINIPILR